MLISICKEFANFPFFPDVTKSKDKMFVKSIAFKRGVSSFRLENLTVLSHRKWLTR